MPLVVPNEERDFYVGRVARTEQRVRVGYEKRSCGTSGSKHVDGLRQLKTRNMPQARDIAELDHSFPVGPGIRCATHIEQPSCLFTSSGSGSIGASAEL